MAHFSWPLPFLQSQKVVTLPLFPPPSPLLISDKSLTTCLPHHKNSNNQRIGSVGDNDRRFKRFCSNTVLCVSFMWQMVMTFYPLKEGKKSWAWSHCVWYIPFLLSGSPKDCWLHTTWRLGLLAPLVARNYLYISALPKTQTSLNLITNRVHHKKTWICFLLL